MSPQPISTGAQFATFLVMALISDPRVFVSPAFGFERSGTFLAASTLVRPEPEELFSCQVLRDSHEPFPLLPGRENARIFRILFGDRNAPINLAFSEERDMGIFWRAELFTNEGHVCDERVYDELWKLKHSNSLGYVSFATEMRPLQVHADGRLIDVILYFALFEADEAEGALMALLQQQSLREVVSTRWQELMSPVLVELRASHTSLCAQIAVIHSAAAEVLEILTPRAKSRGKRLFFWS